MKCFPAVLTLIIFFAQGCAIGPGAVRDEKSLLVERVQGFWTAKSRGDWKTAETYVDPDMRPGLEPYFKELKEGPIYAEFKSFEIKEVKIRGEKAEVMIKYSVKWMHPLLAGLPVQNRVREEEWRKNEGIWYLVMQEGGPLKFFQRLDPK